MTKRIAIVGAGALGGYVGGTLAHLGHDVTLIDAWPEQIETIRARGLELDGMTPEERFTVKSAKTLHLTEVQSLARRPVDVAMVAVKSYDTPWATALIKPYLTAEGFVVSLQNSMGNGVTAATGLTSGECLRNARIRRFQIRLAGEAVRVGQALGYSLEKIRGADPERLARASEGDAAALAQVEALIVPKAGANPRGDIQRPSMAQDILKGRRTEIDAMNGYIARKGAEVGVPAPSQARLAEIVTRVERGELAPAPSHLEDLGE